MNSCGHVDDKQCVAKGLQLMLYTIKGAKSNILAPFRVRFVKTHDFL